MKTPNRRPTPTWSWSNAVIGRSAGDGLRLYSNTTAAARFSCAGGTDLVGAALLFLQSKFS